MNLEEKTKEIQESLRNMSLDLIKGHFGDSKLEIGAIPETYTSVLGHWVSVILVSGPPFRLTFKCHYLSSDIKSILNRITGEELKDIAIEKAKDFMSEFCNVFAGVVKKSYQGENFELGISLPLVMDGVDEIFFSHPKRTHFSDQWGVFKDGEIMIFTSYLFEVLDEKLLENLNIVEEEDEDDFFL